MDPVTALGLVSSVLSIIDGLAKAYEYGETVYQADKERKEFNTRLDYVGTVASNLKTPSTSEERAQPGQKWLALIDPKNEKSPVKGLEAGADATIPDEFGRTVNQLAKLSNEKRMINLARSIKSSIWPQKMVVRQKQP